jgi:uncharacterized membrane protein
MALLIAAMALLIAGHLVPSAPGVRDRLFARFGRAGFYSTYALLSTISLGLVVWAFQAQGPGPWLYEPAASARLIALLVMPFALFLVIGRLTTPAASDHAVGIYRITAVPGSLGLLLWTLVHLLNLGETRALVLFGGLALLALISLLKHLALAGPAHRSSDWLPFAAIIGGRERLVWHEIGWWRVGVAGLTYLLLLALHPVVIGRDPLAGQTLAGHAYQDHMRVGYVSHGRAWSPRPAVPADSLELENQALAGRSGSRLETASDVVVRR